MADLRSEREYECQLFTYDRAFLKQCLRELIEETIRRETSAALDELSTAVSVDKESLQKISDKLTKLEQFFLNNAAKHLTTIDERLDSALSIPPSVVLPPDDEDRPTREDLEQLKIEKEAARRRTLEASAAYRLLQCELKVLTDPKMIALRESVLDKARLEPQNPPSRDYLSQLLKAHVSLHSS